MAVINLESFFLSPLQREFYVETGGRGNRWNSGVRIYPGQVMELIESSLSTEIGHQSIRIFSGGGTDGANAVTLNQSLIGLGFERFKFAEFALKSKVVENLKLERFRFHFTLVKRLQSISTINRCGM